MSRFKYILITVVLAAIALGVITFLKGPSGNDAPPQNANSSPEPTKQLNFKINP